MSVTPPIVAASLAEPPPAALRIPAQRREFAVPSGPPASLSRRVLTQIAAIRVVLTTVAAGVSSVWPHPSDRLRAFAFLVALVWLPVALVIFIRNDEPTRALNRYSGWLVDVAGLGLALALIPNAPGLVQPARFLLLVVALTALYSCYEMPAFVAPAVSIVVGIAGTLAHGTGTTNVVACMVFTCVTGIAAVAWRSVLQHRRATARVETWLRDRTDTVVDHMPTPVMLTNDVGVITRWNPATTETLAVPLERGDHCSTLGLHHGERALDCSQTCALRELCGAGPDISVELWRPAGEGRQPQLASVTAVPAAGHGPVEVLHTFRDITRLKEADEAKTVFLATASHELKTPLTVIRGFAEMLNNGRLVDEEARGRAYEAIYTRSLELGRVVDRLLMSSRIDAGRVAVRVDPLDVAAIVTERTTAFEASVQREIQVTVEGDLVPALAEPLALATVVDHLIENAVKYSADTTPVEVRIHPSPYEVRIVIHDHGIGMTREEVRRCFDRFWQADSGDRRRFGGTGIGLYIARSLVESMGGRIDVVSQLGVGTTFTVSLPTTREEPEGVPAPRTPVVSERSIIREFMRQIGVPAEPSASEGPS